MIRLRPSGADEVLIKRVRDWYEPGPGVFIAPQVLFSPALLFTTGVNGTWYDPSDLTTLFQDAAGTTPVTAVEQPVGLMLDKSGRGNHAFNSSGNSANFPVLSARYNLLTASELQNGISDLPVKGGSVSLAGTSIDGYVNSASVQYNAAASYAYKTQSVTAGVGYTLSVVVQMDDNGAPAVSASDQVGADLTLVLFSGTGYTPTIRSIGNSQYLVSISGVCPTSGTSDCGVVKYGDQSARGFRVTAYDIRVSNDAMNQPAYQRVNTATDYDTAGFKPYLRFNGVNQWLQTNSIDFTYGDKMFVCAGYRALSSSLYQVATELSASYSSNAGSFVVFKNGSNTQAWYFGSSGTTFQSAEKTGYAEPITNVISGIGNISAPSATLRVNGTQVAQSTVTQGTGNYGNYPLYIGARAGSSLWFNGRLHQLVVAGKQASASEISSTETYTNTKTGAY